MKQSSGKRVLMLIENTFFPQDPRVRREAYTLAAAGYKVSVICPALKAQPAHEVIEGISIYRYPAAPPSHSPLAYMWEYGYSMIAIFLVSLIVFVLEGFDVIHAANPPDTLVFVAAIYKLLGRKFIFDHHDLSPEMYYVRFPRRCNRLIRGLLVTLENMSCRLADHVIVTNESYKRIDMERSHVPESRITVVRNGPEVPTHKPEPVQQFRALGKNIIVFAGSMSVQDGVDHLLRALHYLAFDLGRTDFLCLIVGGAGDARAELKKLSTELGLDPFVVFTGWVEDLFAYISSADICVDPDPSNPFNDRCTMLKMMDYMCMGKPIVAFDLPEHRYSAADAAVYVKGNDDLELARAVANLMDDPQRREQMGRCGRSRVESLLAWRFSSERLLDAYRAVFALPVADEKPPTTGGYIHTQTQAWKNWIANRSGRYVISRGLSLLTRYGLTTHKAKARVRECVEILGRYGCRPTFAVPGRLVNEEPQFCRELQRSGVELAVHGYDHVDFRTLNREQTDYQLRRAVKIFANAGINFDGLRCPYLSATEHVEQAVNGDFRYTSNKAVWWEGLPIQGENGKGAIYRYLSSFYGARCTKATVALPASIGHVVELPVLVPDDIQMLDGLKLTSEQIARAWLRVLRDTHDHGELFVLMFHPETFVQCSTAFEALLQEASRQSPPVWITQLRDVSAWWHERSAASVGVTRVGTQALLEFTCPKSATILVRDLNTPDSSETWDGRYKVLASRSLEVQGDRFPIVGLHPSAPTEVATWLKDIGYFFKIDDSPDRFSVYLGLGAFESSSKLSAYIESTTAPLVCMWRWPNAFKSVLCVTGDLDALSLFDYFARLAA